MPGSGDQSMSMKLNPDGTTTTTTTSRNPDGTVTVTSHLDRGANPPQPPSALPPASGAPAQQSMGMHLNPDGTTTTTTEVKNPDGTVTVTAKLDPAPVQEGGRPQQIDQPPSNPQRIDPPSGDPQPAPTPLAPSPATPEGLTITQSDGSVDVHRPDGTKIHVEADGSTWHPLP